MEYVDFDKFPIHGPAIIVANHQHTFDVSVIHCKLKAWVNWIAKKELFEIPLIGKHIYRMGVIPVDRRKSDLFTAKSMFQKIKNNEILGLFPQGTRMKRPDDFRRIPPKTGAVHIAVRTKTPIIPIGILGNFKWFTKIKVVMGDPIDFSMMPDYDPKNEDLMKMTIYVMTRIYALIGIEYRLDLADEKSKGSRHDD